MFAKYFPKFTLKLHFYSWKIEINHKNKQKFALRAPSNQKHCLERDSNQIDVKIKPISETLK